MVYQMNLPLSMMSRNRAFIACFIGGLLSNNCIREGTDEIRYISS